MRRSALKRHVDAGFTLIELLIVIVILGILAAIVVFSVSGITNKGTTAACQSTVAEVDTAYEAYAAQNTGTTTALVITNTNLGPYFHNGKVPTSAGSNVITPGTTTVANVDAFTC